MSEQKNEILSVRGLKVHYSVHSPFEKGKQFVKAVDDISFSVYEGESFGIVGESGCGKSTMGKAILRLLEPTAGEVFFEGKNLTAMKKQELRQTRSKMQMIFQDPMASLDPHQKVGDIIAEPMRVHRIASADEIKKRAAQLLQDVGLSADSAGRYPHEFSGGQRQRVGIARALALQPKLIVCDEPVSALDVSNQAQILNLLEDLRNHYHLTYLFIAHGLAAVRYISTRIAVMYLGKLVECGESEAICHTPMHPYTQALLSAAIDPDPDAKNERILLTGDVPNPINPPSGCAFHPRCPYCRPICTQKLPQLIETETGRLVACHKINAPNDYEKEEETV